MRTWACDENSIYRWKCCERYHLIQYRNFFFKLNNQIDLPLALFDVLLPQYFSFYSPTCLRSSDLNGAERDLSYMHINRNFPFKEVDITLALYINGEYIFELFFSEWKWRNLPLQHSFDMREFRFDGCEKLRTLMSNRHGFSICFGTLIDFDNQVECFVVGQVQ